jgi:hypothetical protein
LALLRPRKQRFSEHMFTVRHEMTTTAHTGAGLIPICHCGWMPATPLATHDDAVLAEMQHNLGFTLEYCPECAHELVTVPTRWKVRGTTTHFVDRCCPACGWQASLAP